MSDPSGSRLKNDLTPQGPSGRRVEILECTLRDGSYAVDFKFTENDTADPGGSFGQAWFSLD